MWPNTVVSIPSGWARDADFDDRFLHGARQSVEPGSVGGSTTHLHTGNAHSHLAPTHTHDIVGVSATFVRFLGIGGSVSSFPNRTHGHDSVPSGSSSIVYESTTIIVDAASAIPPFMDLIILTPDDENQAVPTDAVLFANLTSAPDDYRLCDGIGGSPDLRDLLVQGPAAGADGGSIGGSADHTHNVPDHSHVSQPHTHPEVSAGPSDSNLLGTVAGVPRSRGISHHGVSLDTTDTRDPLDASVTLGNVSNMPAFLYLLCIQKTAAAIVNEPIGLVVPYAGLIASIPPSWALCDGTSGTQDLRDRQVRCTDSGGSVGTTGGSDTHIHSSTSPHAHAEASSHTHSVTQTLDNIVTMNPGTRSFIWRNAHTHTWTVSPETPAGGSSNVVTQSTDIRQPFREVLFIQRIETQPGMIHRGMVDAVRQVA